MHVFCYQCILLSTVIYKSVIIFPINLVLLISITGLKLFMWYIHPYATYRSKCRDEKRQDLTHLCCDASSALSLLTPLSVCTCILCISLILCVLYVVQYYSTDSPIYSCYMPLFWLLPPSREFVSWAKIVLLRHQQEPGENTKFGDQILQYLYEYYY